MKSAPVYILAGGRSSRFGSDKARAKVDGRTMIHCVVDELGDAAESVCVVADRAGKYEDLGLRTIGDLRADIGPLGGLWTALRDLPEEGEGWLLLAGCDQLGIERRWLRMLLEAVREGDRAVAFRGARWEPTLALYHRRVLECVEAMVEAGQGAMRRLLNEAGAAAVDLPEDWGRLSQINTREDMEAYVARRG